MAGDIKALAAEAYKPRKPKLSVFDRARIFHAWQRGHTKSELAATYRVSRRTIATAIQQEIKWHRARRVA